MTARSAVTALAALVAAPLFAAPPAVPDAASLRASVRAWRQAHEPRILRHARRQVHVRELAVFLVQIRGLGIDRAGPVPKVLLGKRHVANRLGPPAPGNDALT